MTILGKSLLLLLCGGTGLSLLSCTNNDLGALQGTSGSIVGVIKPDSARATVRALQIEEKGRAETGSDGRFEIKKLQPGIYSLEVTAPGFSRVVLDDITIVERGATTVGEIHLSNRPTQIILTDPEDGESDIALNLPIGIFFQKPMNRQSVEQAFSITPALSGELVWTNLGTSPSVQFRPSPRLKPATEYSVSLTKRALTSSGDSLEFDYQFSFTTQPVKTLSVIPENGAVFVRPRSTIAVIFNTFMNLQSVESAFEMDPPTVGDFQWSSFERMSFAPSPSLFANTQYRVTLSTNAQDFEGIPLQEALEFTFRTEPLRVESHNPTDQQTFVSPSSSIFVSFNAAMDQNSVQDAFSLSPAASGEFQWLTATSMLFFPAEDLQTNTTYEVSIDNNAMDLGGARMGSPFSFAFTTRP